MELTNQKMALLSLIQAMLVEGLVDQQFQSLQMFKETVENDFVLRKVVAYCSSVKSKFVHLTDLIDQTNIDYDQVDTSARDLQERSRSIGAERVRVACAELIRAAEENDPEHCLRTLYWMKKEFSQLQQKFEILVKIERKIIELEEGIEKIPSICYYINRHLRLNPQGLLQDYEQSLFDEGIVNDQFRHLLTLKTDNKPDLVMNLISSYLDDMEEILFEFSEDMDSREADFKRLASQARKIAERSSGIGAEHMKLACSNLIRACDEMQGKRFSQAVGWTKIEFARTRTKLDAFVQMEKRIMRLKAKGK